MTLQEMRKTIEKLEKFYIIDKYTDQKLENRNDLNFIIIKKYLLEDRQEDDPDMQALTPQLLEQVIQLFIDCYDTENLMLWLESHDYDPIIDFRFSERYEYEEFESVEELEEAKENCLFNDEVNKIIVMSW